jgi:glycosyltransferase involved in cell wall biosynthesis
VLFSVIIPAYNEELLLPSTISTIKEAIKEYGYDGEIIVVDNNSSDQTNSVARLAGARVIFEEHNQISRARNAGARAAYGKYLFFIDADTNVTEKHISASLSALCSGNYYGGGALVAFDSKLSFFLRQISRLWQCLAEHLNLAAGCFIFCLKDAFDEIGGFSEHVYAAEEIYFSRDLSKWGRKHGKMFLLIDQPVVTSSRKFKTHKTLKVLLLVLILGLFPWLTRFKWACRFWYPNNS